MPSSVRSSIRGVLSTFARGAPVRVFIILGIDPPADPALLYLHPDVIVLDSPRSATILLIAGAVPTAMRDAVKHVHDEMAQPRCTVRWTGRSGDSSASSTVTLGAQYDVSTADMKVLVATLRRAQCDLITGAQASEANELRSTSRAQWRTVGPHGQGGTGMTGGVPYGRPMAERARDRDGLELDQLPLRIGPYFNAFPAGLILDVQLQGDVVQEVIVSAHPVARLSPVFAAALRHPVPITTLECARAQSHLQWLARALRVHGLGALGVRTLRLARQIAENEAAIADNATELQAIARAIARSCVLFWSTRGVGELSPQGLLTTHGLGPISRASGVPNDARTDEPAYRALGFQPIVSTQLSDKHVGTASARWRQRIAEAAQSLDLAARAGEQTGAAHAWGQGVVEGPRGRVTVAEEIDERLEAQPGTVVYEMLPKLLRGMEWGDAVTAVVSLDLGEGGDVHVVRSWDAAEKFVRSTEEATQQAGSSDSAARSGMAGMEGMAQMEH